MSQKEITARVPVLDDAGTPGNFGWARFPAFEYDPARIFSPRRYRAESDRYILFSAARLIVVEILDHGYLGYFGLTVVSLTDKARSSQYWTIPFPLGGFELPGDSDLGEVRVQDKRYSLTFTAMDKGVRIVKVDIPKFGKRGRSLRGELVLTPPPGGQSLVTTMPWRGKRDAFRCTRRSPWYAAEGVILFGAEELVFTRGNSFGVYEWNRGVRPSSDVSFWAAGSGYSGGRHAGISVGYNSADSEAGTENAFFLDGIIHKLDQVTFQISPSNWLLPWRFTSNDGRLEMTFVPHQARAENLQMLFHSLKRRQVFGAFSGRVILDDGTGFAFENITGLTERRKTRF